MNLLQAIFLGAVQGLTEFLPVSSSGHLAIFQNIFHIDIGNSIFFDVLLHVGTLFVVFFIYWKDICRLIVETFRMIGDILHNLRVKMRKTENGQQRAYRKIIRSNYRKFVLLLLIATIPTGLMGYFGRKLISDASSTLLIPGICLLITAVLLFLSDRVEGCWKIPKDVSKGEAVLIGIAQGFATLPGLSRSGTTIAACTFCHFERKFAVKFSFILSIPAILGATIVELGEIVNENLTPGMIGSYFAGMITAAVVGYIAIRIMLNAVKNKKMKYFSYYCFAAGLLAIIGNFFI